MISRIYVPLMPSMRPNHSFVSQSLGTPQNSGRGEKEMGLWQHPAQLEKLGVHSHTLTSPIGEIMSQKVLSWHYTALGEE